MTTPTEVHRWLVEALHAVAPEADLDGVAPDEPLNEQLELDSMDMLTLLERLQQQAGITIPDRDTSKLQTVHGIEQYLVARLGV